MSADRGVALGSALHRVDVPRRGLRGTGELRGVGLFTGRASVVTLGPSDETGLWIEARGARARVSADLLDAEPLHPAFAGMGSRSTNLRVGGTLVGTVEHALSALVGMGITDAALAVRDDHDGAGSDAKPLEVCIGDGSARPFIDAIRAAGVEERGTTEGWAVTREISVERDGARVVLAPSADGRPSYRYALDYGPAAPIARTTVTWDGSAAGYEREIAPARTYSLEAEARAMVSAGLFTHLRPGDMLVIGGDGRATDGCEPLRFRDEPARHKLLDLIGDLALAGRPLVADIRGEESGHALHHEAARAIRA